MFAGSASPTASMLDLEFAELSDVGRVRDHNEDYSGHAVPASEAEGRTHGWLFALADGVGGEETRRSRLPNRHRNAHRGIPRSAERRSAHGADAAPRAIRQYAHL